MLDRLNSLELLAKLSLLNYIPYFITQILICSVGSDPFKVQDVNSRTEAPVSISICFFFHFMEIGKNCISSDIEGFLGFCI